MSWPCPSCGAPAGANFCAQCGEARPLEPAPRRRIRERLHTPWIARLRASLAALGSPPGRLTRDWLEGRRVRYFSPIALFLYVNVGFFLIQSASHVSILSFPYHVHVDNDVLGIGAWFARRLAGPGFAADATRVAVFDATEQVYAKALVVLMLPMVTAAAMLLPTPRRAGFAASFTFVTHYFTFALIALSALFPLVSIALNLLRGLGVRPSPDAIDDSVVSVQVAILVWYLVRAYGTTTALPAWRRLLMAGLVVCASWLALRLYHVIVFVVTLAFM